jgi:hypothetical protein
MAMHPRDDIPMGYSVAITVEVRTEYQQRESLYSVYDADRPATPLDPTFPLTPVLGLPSRSRTVPEPPYQTFQSSLQPGEAALQMMVRNEMTGFHTLFNLPELPFGRPMPTVDETLRLIWADICGLVVLGQELLSQEKLKNHAKAIPAEEIEVEQPAMYWVQRLQPLKSVDRPLYHMLRDSLHPHTPQYILQRWNILRKHLSVTGQVLAHLVRQAELLPRRKWPPLVNELYFLLLEYVGVLKGYEVKLILGSHNETMTDSLLSSAMSHDCNLEWELNAYCAALRIRFYLWRMTRRNPICDSETYKQRVRKECFRCYCKQLSNLVAHEFVRVQETGNFQDIKRELVGDAVVVATISEALTGTAAQFCTICQDNHPSSDCITPHNCSCVFGRDCLQPLLNRDTPSSYTCPNCRTRLHEPLTWKPLEVSSERDIRVGLLWALRSNVVCLQREITADPEPFTQRQRVGGFFGRIVYGR